MCQAFEGEQRSEIRGELYEIRRRWERHKSGECILNRDQLLELAVKKMMLEEAL